MGLGPGRVSHSTGQNEPVATAGQLAIHQPVKLQPDVATHPTASFEQFPAYLVEPLDARLTVKARPLGAAHLIHRLIQVAGDMETNEPMQALAGLGRQYLEVRRPV